MVVLSLLTKALQNKLEVQYAAKRDAHISEVQDLKQQLEMKGNEIRNLNSSIDSLKSVNEELKVLPTLPISVPVDIAPDILSVPLPSPLPALRGGKILPKAPKI